MRDTRSHRTATTVILCTAVSLSAFLAAMRGVTLGVVPPRGSAAYAIRTILAGAIYDVAFVAALTAAFVALLWWCSGSPVLRRLIVSVYVIAATLALFAGLLNIENVKQLGGPFTYQWLYYSDFLASKEAHDAIAANLSWRLVVTASVVSLMFYAASATLVVAVSWVSRELITPRTLVVAGGALAAAYVLTSVYLMRRSEWAYTKIANPVVAFAASYFWETPEIFTMATPVGGPEVGDGPAEAEPQRSLAPRAQPPVVNVVLYVLESVPARYIGIYGSPHGATPVLDAQRGASHVFENVYAHVPNSPKALVALLISLYGRIGYADVTSEHPDIAVPALSSVLDDRGYRTAMFYGSDLRYSDQDEFLAARGFDFIQDHRSRSCSVPTFVDTLEEEEFLDGSADRCTASAFRAWLGEAPRTPFFAVLWTMQTHYPYFVTGEEKRYGVGSRKLNRYLNALYEGDRALGQVLATLEENGQADSTVVVVVGDHGESFGDHGQWGHGSSIYEENVHVPLVFLNRRLFHGDSSSAVGNLVDVAPTIADVLGLPSVPQWQGRSLFRDDTGRRAYFFSSWTNLIFGYRHGSRKYILNATENRYEIYDLAFDPGETVNLATGAPAETLAIQQQLASWVQQQDRLLDRLSDPQASARNP